MLLGTVILREQDDDRQSTVVVKVRDSELFVRGSGEEVYMKNYVRVLPVPQQPS